MVPKTEIIYFLVFSWHNFGYFMIGKMNKSSSFSILFVCFGEVKSR